MAIGDKLASRNHFAVDDHFDRYPTSILDAASFQMPVGLFVQTSTTNRFRQGSRLRFKKGRSFKGNLDLAWGIQIQSTDSVLCAFTDGTIVDLEVQDVAEPIAAVASPIPQALNPVLIGEFFTVFQPDVNSPETDSITVDTRKVCFAADA